MRTAGGRAARRVGRGVGARPRPGRRGGRGDDQVASVSRPQAIPVADAGGRFTLTDDARRGESGANAESVARRSRGHRTGIPAPRRRCPGWRWPAEPLLPVSRRSMMPVTRTNSPSRASVRSVGGQRHRVRHTTTTEHGQVGCPLRSKLEVGVRVGQPDPQAWRIDSGLDAPGCRAARQLRRRYRRSRPGGRSRPGRSKRPGTASPCPRRRYESRWSCHVPPRSRPPGHDRRRCRSW